MKITCILFLCLGCQLLAQDQQTWTNNQGKTIEAQFVEADDSTVTLLFKGQRVVVQLADLNEESQRQAVELRGAPTTKPAVPGEKPADGENLLEKEHQWKNTQGKVITAKFVRSDGSTVTIFMAGREIPYPLANLSPESRELAAKLRGMAVPAKLEGLGRPTGKPALRSPWVRSFSSGGEDVNGEFLGGSEVHHLVGHKGKLYAATGYWMDENNPYYSRGKNKQWAQVLVKERKGAPWKEEYDTGDDRGVLRPEILKSVVFRRPHPDVNLLFLATYRTDHDTYYVDVMVRNDATGKWIKTTPHSGPKTSDPHDVSVRAMRVYTDRITREERIYLTIGSKGVLSGVYDPKVKGWIRWRPFHPVPFSNRALSICEADRSLVIGAGDAVWRRKDGASPEYEEIHHFRDLDDRPVHPGIGGIRGMTTIKNPNGTGHSLLLFWTNPGRAGARGSIYRLDPDGKGGYTRHEDVRLAPVLREEMGVHATFFLGAYSYFQSLRNPATGQVEHLVGLYVQLGHGEHSYPTWNKVYKGGLYAIRDEKGRYRINEVNGRHNGLDTPMTAVRAIEPSPFPGDTDVYFGGHDCAGNMSTDFAWIYKAPLRTALRLSK